MHLLKPGGYLVTAEYDPRGDYARNTPIMAAAAKQLEVKMRAKGLVPHFAAQIGGVLRATREFDEVAVKTVTLPLNASLVSGASSWQGSEPRHMLIWCRPHCSRTDRGYARFHGCCIPELEGWLDGPEGPRGLPEGDVAAG